tara:strand:- start:175 stop:600 length:426 start_codon:yes stop_codon:yes gene_type:complete
MRCCTILALCASQQAVPAMAPSPRGALSRALMYSGLVNPIERFDGSLYGVNVRVNLNMRTRVATVTLYGAVLGGTVQGTGKLADADAEAGSVVLERTFETRLRRRFVTIQRAALDRERMTVTVWARVPILGEIEVVLAHSP